MEAVANTCEEPLQPATTSVVRTLGWGWGGRDTEEARMCHLGMEFTPLKAKHLPVPLQGVRRVVL